MQARLPQDKLDNAVVHGIEVDTIMMQARLPQDKLDNAVAVLRSFSEGRK